MSKEADLIFSFLFFLSGLGAALFLTGETSLISLYGALTISTVYGISYRVRKEIEGIADTQLVLTAITANPALKDILKKHIDKR